MDVLATRNLRTNRRHSELIDEAVALQERAGTIVALEYLKSHSFTPPVIERVLLYPQRRRPPGNPDVMHKN